VRFSSIGSRGLRPHGQQPRRDPEPGLKARAGFTERLYIRCDADLDDDPAVNPSNIEGRARSIQLEDSEKVRIYGICAASSPGLFTPDL